MKSTIFLSATAVLWAACGTTSPDHVVRTDEGVRVYHVDEQPQANVTGSGTVMRGAYDPRTAPTGAFTGKETSQGQVGQFPTPPPESTAETRVHKAVEPAEEEEATEDLNPAQVGSGIVPPREGAGAGTLGQTGIYPPKPVTSSTIMSEPNFVDPPTAQTAPTLSEPLTSGTGSAPGIQSGADEEMADLPATATLDTGIAAGLDRSASAQTPMDNLTLCVREVLSTGRPGTITHLTPERLDHIEIEARNNTITLRGDVSSQTEKLMLERKVRSIEGVKNVNNQLRVITPTRPHMQDPTSPGDRSNPLYPEK